MSRRRQEKSVLPGSSYWKVLSALAALPASKEILANLENLCGASRISNINFSVNSWDASVSHNFVLEVGKDQGAIYSSEESQERLTRESLQKILLSQIEDDCKRVIKNNLGQKHCPSYNCSADRLNLSEFLFKNWAYEQTPGEGLSQARPKGSFASTTIRLVNEIVTLSTSEEFAHGRKMKLSRGAIEEIKKALKKFHEVSEDVVQEAVNEYLTERVVDS